MRKIIDLEGQRFGRLLVLGDSGKRADHGCVMWNCLCDCGNFTVVRASNLRLKHTKSCGCLHKDCARELNFKHGDGSRINGTTRLYRTWYGMKDRCHNKNYTGFKYYGGRGITVCDEWKNDYMVFKNWALNNGYADNLTIDRIDNDKGYYPENCQWLTRSENTKKAQRRFE